MEPWEVTDDAEHVLEWFAYQDDMDLQETVLEFIRDLAIAPEERFLMSVPTAANALPVFFAIVPHTTVAVKFAVDEQRHALAILKVRTLTDI